MRKLALCLAVVIAVAAVVCAVVYLSRRCCKGLEV